MRVNERGRREGDMQIYLHSCFSIQYSPEGLCTDSLQNVGVTLRPPSGSADTTARDKAGIISPSSENHDD